MKNDYLLNFVREYAKEIRDADYYEEYFADNDYSKNDKKSYKDVYNCMLDYCITTLENNIQYDFGFEFDAKMLLK